MPRISTDHLDKEILHLLQSGEAACPNVSFIAKALKKPTTTIHSRIKKLEKKGVVKEYIAVLDPKKLGHPVTAFMLLQMKPGEDPDKVSAKLAKIQGVKEIHFTTGEWYFLLKLKVKDLNEYYKISGEEVVRMPELSEIVGMIAPKSHKEDITTDIWGLDGD